MATSRFCKKCLKSTCEIVFYCTWWLKFCDLYMKYAFSHRSPIKDVFQKTSQNSQKHIFAGFIFLMKLQVGNLKLSKVADEDDL